jgi:acetyl-CoA carboxylase carboxyl transferase subunit alpha
VAEPLGGAQRDREAAIHDVGKAIASMLAPLKEASRADLIAARRRKYLDLGSKGLAA